MITTKWTSKAWGRTRPIYDSDVFCGHELDVEQGGYSSVHYHQHRANKFIVDSGVIAVVVFWGWRSESVMLTKGQDFTLPSLVVHQFQVYQSGRVREEYWADRGGKVSQQDIIRLSEGGKVSDIEELKTLTDNLITGRG